MPYVMVPVPEEYVEEVMQYVVRARARANIASWDAESVNRLYAEVDEPTRSLLSYVARAALAGKELPEADAARKIELTARETLGILRELNDLAREGSYPSIISRRTISETLANGRTVDTRVLVMAEDVAAFVRDAERADLASAMPPMAVESQS